LFLLSFCPLALHGPVYVYLLPNRYCRPNRAVSTFRPGEASAKSPPCSGPQKQKKTKPFDVPVTQTALWLDRRKRKQAFRGLLEKFSVLLNRGRRARRERKKGKGKKQERKKSTRNRLEPRPNGTTKWGGPTIPTGAIGHLAKWQKNSGQGVLDRRFSHLHSNMKSVRWGREGQEG